MTYIFLPSYNEWENLPETLIGIKNILNNRYHYEIVVIDDGSIDGTFENCQKFFPEIKVIKHINNKGIGGVFKSIISYLIYVENNSNFIIMEADGTSNSYLLPNIIEKLENKYDIVIASRYKNGGKYKNFPFKRKILSKTANNLFSLIFFGLGVRDFTIFFRGYKTSIVKQTYKKYKEDFITSKGFCSNIEFLIKIIKGNNLEIFEIPFEYDYKKKKGKSKLKILKNLKEYSVFILKIIYFYYFLT